MEPKKDMPDGNKQPPKSMPPNFTMVIIIGFIITFALNLLLNSMTVNN